MTAGTWGIFIAAIVGLTIIGGKVRALVRRNAPFYAKKNILIAGIVFGVIFAFIVYVVGRESALSPWALWFLGFWGFLSAGYMGFQPNEIDLYKKAQQTATVAELSYLILIFILYVAAAVLHSAIA